MNGFRVKEYEYRSPKIKNPLGARMAVISDLHCNAPVKKGKDLVEVITELAPDIVLVTGDLAVRRQADKLPGLLAFMQKIAGLYPTIMVRGNHETALLNSLQFQNSYIDFERSLWKAGVCILSNDYISMNIHGDSYVFYGMELSRDFYKKPFGKKLSLRDFDDMLLIPAMPGLSVLLSHNPKFGNIYFSSQADLILSGHYHGGIVRFSETTGLLSPQFRFFPPYCCGSFEKDGKMMIVSGGLGDHFCSFRFHNPRELILLSVLPDQKPEEPVEEVLKIYHPRRNRNNQ